MTPTSVSSLKRMYAGSPCSPLLCDAHENILAVKGDAATKEEMVWGFRVGFLTFNSAGLSEEHYEALVKENDGCNQRECKFLQQARTIASPQSDEKPLLP